MNSFPNLPLSEPTVRHGMAVMLPMKTKPADPVFLSLRLFNGWTALALMAAVLLVGSNAAIAQATAPAHRSIITILADWTPTLLKGFGFNVLISIMAMAIGTVLGVFLGIFQVSHVKLIRSFAWLITQFFRNSPWLVLLFYCILLIPFKIEIFGATIPFPAWIKAVIGLSLPVMAYMSEFMRGAILSIPTGQWESANSLGFSRRQTMTDIILPQTVKRVLPSWMNLYAVLTMATPLVSIIGVNDVMALTRAALSAESRVDLLIPMYLYILCWFFLYCYPISTITAKLERRYAVAT